MKTFISLVSAVLLVLFIGFFAVHTYKYFTYSGKTQFNFENTAPKALNNPCKSAQSLQHCKELSQ